MKETWGFDIGGGVTAKHYGTKAFTYSTVDYAAKIIPESFQGVQTRIDIVSKLYAPNQTEFDISNTDGLLAETDFQGLRCCISQLLNGVLNRQWTFVIETAVEEVIFRTLRIWQQTFLQMMSQKIKTFVCLLLLEPPLFPAPRLSLVGLLIAALER